MKWSEHKNGAPSKDHKNDSSSHPPHQDELIKPVIFISELASMYQAVKIRYLPVVDHPLGLERVVGAHNLHKIN
jgi:hypothetical protein